MKDSFAAPILFHKAIFIMKNQSSLEVALSDPKMGKKHNLH